MNGIMHTLYRPQLLSFTSSPRTMSGAMTACCWLDESPLLALVLLVLATLILVLGPGTVG